MSIFGRVFGKPTASDDHEDDAEVENLLHQISDARHASERRDSMCQLRDLLQNNPSAQAAMGAMGLPVILSVLQEDREDIELVKGALEVLHLSVLLPPQQQQQVQGEVPPAPALINADLYCRVPDNVLLLLGLLRDEPEGVDDFYVRYGALQVMGALMTACQDKLQACVLSSPLGVVALMDFLSSPLEVLRNEALLLLVGLCNGCPQISNIAAFEGAFDKLLAICGSEGGPASGDVVVQDAAELINNLLRDNQANQRLFREMGHINQLPPLLHFNPQQPPPAAAAAAAGSFLSSASQYVDPSIRAAAGAAAAAAANSTVGAAVAAAGAAWPAQVSANYLCLLETARLLLAPVRAAAEDQQAQDSANRRANQDVLSQHGLLQVLVNLAAEGGGAPSTAVRAQALFCLGDFVHSHAQLQEQLAGVGVTCGPLHHQSPQQQQQQQSPGSKNPPTIPLLQLALQIVLHGNDELERGGALHLLQGFCYDNQMGQMAVMSTIAPSDNPHSFGQELLAALICTQTPSSSSSSSSSGQQQQQSPWGPPSGRSQGLTPQNPSPLGPGFLNPQTSALQPLDLQLVAGRAATVLQLLLYNNPNGQNHLLTLQLSQNPGDTLLPRIVKTLAEVSRRADGKAVSVSYNMLRLLITWCEGCSAAVGVLLGVPSHLPLLVDVAGGRVPGGNVHTAGLATVLLGVCLMSIQGSPAAQQQLLPAAAAGPSSITFNQLLDVLLNRVGLSQFFGAINDMRSSQLFQAAAAAPWLPAHITRSAAAAVLEAEAAAAAAAGSSDRADGGLLGVSGSSSSRSGGWGLLSNTLTAAAAADNGTTAAAAEQQPYDHAFTRFVDHVAEAVQQLTLNAFSGTTDSTAAAAAAAAVPWQPAAAVANGPGSTALLPLQPSSATQQQQQASDVGPGSGISPPPPVFSAPAGLRTTQGSIEQPQQQQQQQGSLPQQQQQQGPLAALAAQLPGLTTEEKLQSALHEILRLQGNCSELQNRNRSLAADGSAGSGAAAAANGYGPVPPAAAAAAAGSAPVSSDAESRVALQLRASRAEMEAGAVRQQLSAMQDQWAVLESRVAEATAAADDARAAAAKADADLADLSAAYNSLEAHAFELEEQLKQQQQGRESAAAAAAAAVGGEASSSGEDVDQHVAAAAARAAAAAEAEAEMEDLLACLGEEQAKVEALSSRLLDLGEDVDKILAEVAAAEEGNESEGDGTAAGGNDLL